MVGSFALAGLLIQSGCAIGQQPNAFDANGATGEAQVLTGGSKAHLRRVTVAFGHPRATAGDGGASPTNGGLFGIPFVKLRFASVAACASAVIIICAFYVKFKSATRRAADCGSADPDLGPGEYGLGDCDWDDDEYDYPDAIREEQSAVPFEDAETNWADDGMDSDGVTDL